MKGRGFTPSRNTIMGQLKLPTSGSSGGILLGGDVGIYRAGADVLELAAPTVTIEECLEHKGDIDTLIQFTSNDILLKAGNTGRFKSNATGVHLFGGTPAAQPAHEADPTDLATCITAINSLIDKLKTLGVLAADP